MIIELMNKVKLYIQNFVLLFISLIISISICELVSRKFISIGYSKFVNKNELNWKTRHNVKKHTLTPKYKGVLTSPEFNNIINVNSMGFRGPEPIYPLELTTKKVFVIGDSFVFGWGVEEHNAIPAKIEYFFNESMDSEVSAWNLGVPDYTTQQYIYHLEEYLQIQNPDFVVLCSYVGRLPIGGGNDIGTSVDFEKWEEKQYNSLTIENIEDKPSRGNSKAKTSNGFFSWLNSQSSFQQVKSYLKWNSALYNVILHRFGTLIRPFFNKRIELTDKLKIKNKRGWKILNEQMAYLKKLSIKYGFKVIMVYIPEAHDVVNKFDLSDEFNRIIRENNFLFVNGFDLIHKNGNNANYFPIDGHLNIKGCELFGKTIAEKLGLFF